MASSFDSWGGPAALVLLLLGLVGGLATGKCAPATPMARPETAADLFRITNVWTAHVLFDADQWAAMEPKRRGGGFPGFGGPGGPGGGGGANLRNPEAKRNGLAGVIGLDFEYVRADLEFNGQRLPNVVVRYKGNGTYMMSQSSDKRPLKIDLNRNAKGQKLAGVAKLNFANVVADASYVSDPLSYELFREAEVPAPRTAYARVSISVASQVTNQYLGLYTLVENVDSTFAVERFGTKKGLILKPVTPRLFEYLGEDWQAYKGIYDPKTPVTVAGERRVIELARLVSQADDDQFRAKIGDYVDLDEFARFMAVTVFLSTYDSILAMGQNFYLYLHPVSEKFLFVPWDLDHSFGEFPMVGTEESRLNASIDHPWVGENRFLERVMALDQFKEIYHRRFGTFLRTIFRPEKIVRRLDEVAAAIRPAVAEESAERLARFEQAVADNRAGTGKVENPAPRRWGPFGGAPHQIKSYVAQRTAVIADQLAGKSKGEVVMRGRMGPGGPGGGGFPGPAMFLAPVFTQAADANRDGRISAAEFAALGERWFKAWDTNRAGRIGVEKLHAGLAAAFPPAEFGGPPGFGGGRRFGPPGGNDRGPGAGPLPGPPPAPGSPRGLGPTPGFGPAMFLSPAFMNALDTDKDGELSEDEFAAGFQRWFKTWDKNGDGLLEEAELRAGINKDLTPFPGGGPPGGPPGGPMLAPLGD